MGEYTWKEHSIPENQGRILLLVALGVIVTMFTIHVTDTMQTGPTTASSSLAHRNSNKINLQKELDYSVAKAESYGFFDDISQKHWDLHKLRVKERENHNDEHLGQRSKMVFMDQPNAWYQNNWEPDFSCKHERRVGDLGAGSRWVCDPHRIPRVAQDRVDNGGNPCLIYTVGNMGNLKFEYKLREMLGKETCEIHVFDNSYHFDKYKTMDGLEGVQFHPWSLEGSHKTTNARHYMTLQETVEALGHKKRVIDIFKIDCEKCEWDTFRDWFNSDVVMMQILVEVHGSPNPEANEFFETMQKFNYVTTHKEPNTHFSGGRCQEYSFLKLAPEFFNF
eukprot:CAMPEP_0178972462 /NCGR_PEP_ID=MMETSP0789-20121207/21031_1 /TAXON_ID=3005 /ORGANISM="Rhizosolenia setigera, Strain CCMP 1694" /LENGTH=334 /DNA_ID=CAMNT_0020659921 /DNA_START=22 /DNA_END=1026 /DNA_ORIENTATION=-